MQEVNFQRLSKTNSIKEVREGGIHATFKEQVIFQKFQGGDEMVVLRKGITANII